MTKILKYNFILLLAALVSACATSKQPNAQHKTITVGPQKADCVGVGPQECLQIKEGDATTWSNFYGSIEGFDYEEGYEYVLNVAVSQVDNPPADGSSLHYKLVKVVKKTENKYPLLNGTWVITTLNEKETNPLITYINFDTSENRINGFAGCNGLGGSMEYNAEDGTIKSGPFMSTMMFCEEVAENERALGKILENFNAFDISDDILTLKKDDEVLVTAKKGVNHMNFFRNWEVSFIEGVDDFNGHIPNFIITNKGEISGSGSCNNFHGKVTMDAYSTTIKMGPLAATRKMCQDNNVEGAFFAKMDLVDNYKIVDGELQLLSGQQVIIKAKRK
ncbi:META domain-containing protein [Flammeovirga sp. SubArs3]|uniref:META domain-containing protein n=1 Tax=Flammeovirga sp. SubArs3 TaxID=2995316 RepID=UPI00248C1300|nr:META domain-containing protein [Flammeovirga sp. SubArs3]